MGAEGGRQQALIGSLREVGGRPDWELEIGVRGRQVSSPYWELERGSRGSQVSSSDWEPV